MEVAPAVFGNIILLRKKIKYHGDKELSYFPNITVIVPVYNSADTLVACLDSIYTSSYPNDKISVILVNNESKDNSFDIMRHYQETHNDMEMNWMNAKQGKSKALNMALFNSKGKYIIHIDSDGILQKEAIMNIVKRFEAHDDIHCMTGSVLTSPQLVEEEKRLGKRMLKTVEFFEYCQAFLAGRNFQGELDMIFTMSGAFSSFRKSTILKTRLYNTETLCEDTHITFQVRYLLKKKIHICENALFFVDPIESISNLYVQRQRWQKGEIEVIHMFPPNKNLLKGFFTNFVSRLMLFDHTFAFPRMIWYFALLFLTFLNYPFRYIAISVTLIFILYIISSFLNFLCICSYLNWNKRLKKFYANRIQYVVLLPFFNFIMYWFRFAGIINGIKGARTWSTRSYAQEKQACLDIVHKDISRLKSRIEKIKVGIYKKNEKLHD